jgi:hypothetical protein
MKQMKRYILLALTLISVLSVSAQNDADALRFSQYFYGGTARFTSMGGAFGALGGDFGSLSINPAGIGVYRAGEFTITPNMNYSSTLANYLDTKYTDYNEKFLLNNLGFVSTFNSNKTDGWISTSIGLGYNRLNDFNRTTFITAVNKTNSLLDNFIQNANGNAASALDPFYEKLAYDADLIYNPNLNVIPANYKHDLMTTYNELQQQSIVSSGGIGEYLISFGANYNHKLYLGASFGIQQASYDEVKSHTETADNVNFPNPYLNSFTFTENYNVQGTGYAFKIGAIYKPIEMIRIGLAIHFPTYYKMHGEFSTNLDVNFRHINDSLPDHVSNASPNISVNDYSMTTPWRMIGSLGLQFGKIGLLSMDFERVDYSSMRFNSNTENTSANQDIQKYYKTAYNIRLGGEVKLGPLALRAGYAAYGSPYVKGYGNDNTSTSNISAGIGFRGSRFFCDLAYVMALQKVNYILYTTQDAGQTFANQAALTIMTSQVMATIGFRF